MLEHCNFTIISLVFSCFLVAFSFLLNILHSAKWNYRVLGWNERSFSLFFFFRKFSTRRNEKEIRQIFFESAILMDLPRRKIRWLIKMHEEGTWREFVIYRAIGNYVNTRCLLKIISPVWHALSGPIPANNAITCQTMMFFNLFSRWKEPSNSTIIHRGEERKLMERLLFIFHSRDASRFD